MPHVKAVYKCGEEKTMSQIDYEAEQELECLVESLGRYSEAKQRQKQAYDEYQGYSPGWALSSYNDSVKDAAVDFGNYLGKVIDRRVERKIAALQNIEGGA
jgi:isocitrate lyase